jgi:hypothetical protein
MNDIMRSSLIVTIVRAREESARNAERMRLLNEAKQDSPSRFSRFVRVPIGRSLVATGQWVHGRAAAPAREEGNASPALKLAR